MAEPALAELTGTMSVPMDMPAPITDFNSGRGSATLINDVDEHPPVFGRIHDANCLDDPGADAAGSSRDSARNRPSAAERLV
jgi:hypothetical protein